MLVVEARMEKANAELEAMVLARGCMLMDLHGVGPVVAARVLADVGDVASLASTPRAGPTTDSSASRVRSPSRR